MQGANGQAQQQRMGGKQPRGDITPYAPQGCHPHVAIPSIRIQPLSTEPSIISAWRFCTAPAPETIVARIRK